MNDIPHDPLGTDELRKANSVTLASLRDDASAPHVDLLDNANELLSIQKAILTRFGERYAAIVILAAEEAEQRTSRAEAGIYLAELRDLEQRYRLKEVDTNLTRDEITEIRQKLDKLSAQYGFLSRENIERN